MSLTTSNEVAAELDGLADEQPDYGQLHDLASALRELNGPTHDQARRWATIGLQDAFLGEEYAVRGERGPLWHYLNVASQALIFVPIVLTWTGLGWATIAYHEGLADPKLAGVPFLQGWQAGFDGRLPAFATFGYLAWYTVTIVIVLISLVILNGRHTRHVEGTLRAGFRRRLASALTRADLMLADLRLGMPDRMARELEAAADALGKSVTEIELAGVVAGEIQRQAAETLNAAVPVISPLKDAAASVESAASSLTGLQAKLGAEISQLGGQLRTEIDQLKTEIGTGIGQLAMEVGQLGGQFGSGISQLGGSLDAAVAQLGVRLSGEIGQLGSELDGTMGQLTADISGHLATMAAAASTAATAQRDGARATTESAGRIADAVGQGTQLVRDSLADVSGTVALYVHRTEAATDILGQAHETIAELPRTVTQVQDGVAELRGEIASLNVSLGDLARRLAGVSTPADQLARLAAITEQLSGLVALGDQLAALATAMNTLTAFQARDGSGGADPADAEALIAAGELRAVAADLRTVVAEFRASLAGLAARAAGSRPHQAAANGSGPASTGFRRLIRRK